MKFPAMSVVAAAAALLFQTPNGNAFAPSPLRKAAWKCKNSGSRLYSDWQDDGQDSNKWLSSNDNFDEQEDWESVLNRKSDGSFWTQFDPTDDGEAAEEIVNKAPAPEEVTEADTWLDTLASLQAEEIEFNLKEADRADKVRAMQEWGFDNEVISNTLGVNLDSSLEKDEVEGMQQYRQDSYLDEEDLSLVERYRMIYGF